MEEDWNHISFKDATWLQHFGLAAHNALDYFALSQFYDRTCNNEVVKMQTKFNNLDEMHMQMSQMQGMEYVLAHVQEPVLYVIRKQHRLSPEEGSPLPPTEFVHVCRTLLGVVEPVEFFYILEGTIFRSPSLYDILASRMTTTVYHLQESFRIAQDSYLFHPVNQNNWRVEAPPEPTPTSTAIDRQSSTTDSHRAVAIAAGAEDYGRSEFFRKRVGRAVYLLLEFSVSSILACLLDRVLLDMIQQYQAAENSNTSTDAS